jgi:hypothetical protein
MRAKRAAKEKSKRRYVVRVVVPLDGLGRLAERLNRFETDPLQGGQLAGLSPDARLMRWLLPELADGAGFAEAVRTVLQQIVGRALLMRLRRCEECQAWMVATRRTRRRCGTKCHTKVWTRRYRHEQKQKSDGRKKSRRRSAGV